MLHTDHFPYRTDIMCYTPEKFKTFGKQLVYKKTCYDKVNAAKTESPFSPICCSNFKELVRQGHSWLNKKLKINIPRVTKYRNSLQPWIVPKTSYLLKKIATEKRKSKILNLENELGLGCITHRVISDRVHRLLVTLSYFRPDRFVQLLSLIPILILLLYYLVSGCLTSLC